MIFRRRAFRRQSHRKKPAGCLKIKTIILLFGTKYKELSMKKTRIFCCIFLGLSFFAFAQKQTIKLSSVAPTRSPWDVEQKKLGQEWAKISGNQISVQFFDTTAMGGESSVIQKLRAVRPGQKAPLDGAIFTNIGIYELAPESKILTLCVPFMFRDQAEVDYIFDKYSGDMRKAIKDKGYEVLGWFSVGWIRFFTKEAAETPAKLKSLRLTMGGSSSSDLTKAFQIAGFKTENIATEKIAQSIKMPGGLQGLYNVPMFVYATKYYESLKYVLDAPICPVFSVFVISNSVWDTIPASYKPQLIKEVEKSQSLFAKMQIETDEHYLDLMEKAGLTRIRLTDSQRALWERELAGDAQRMAANGSTVIDQTFLNQITAALTEYRSKAGRP
jgi:TRAP-type C4-dicarboxylate transport system substrate-binding protein